MNRTKRGNEDQPARGPAPGYAGWSGWPWSGFSLGSARQVWDSAPNPGKIIVAVIDDGFDLQHPALRDNLWQVPGRPDVHGWDFVASDLRVPAPARCHGTMVAGIIGGRPDPAVPFAGVAPNASLMLLRWRSDHPPDAHANPANMAAALRFAINHGARIVNLSAGIDTAGKPAGVLAELESTFKLAEARNVLVVVAAPNTPQNMDTAACWLPGVYPFENIIHVTGLCRELRLLGAWGAKSVDLAAPSEDIIGPTPGGGYCSGCATSFAAPLVSGALALVWGLLPNLRARQVRRLILRNAKPPCPSASSRDVMGVAANEHRPGADCRLRPNETWGHQFPATPWGRLDLGFVEEAYKRYWARRSWPQGKMTITRRRGDSVELLNIAGTNASPAWRK